MRARPESGFSRRRPLFWMALAYCAGIFLDATVSFSFLALIAFIVSTLVGAIFTAFFFRRAAFVAGLCTALFLGAAIHAARFRIPSDDDVASRLPDRACFAWVRGRIVEAEWRTNRGALASAAAVQGAPQRAAWTVAVDALGREAQALSPACGKIRVFVKLDARSQETASVRDNASAPVPATELAAKLAEGDRVEFLALLEPLSPATLPDGFDYAAYLAGLGIHRTGTVSIAALQKLSEPEWWHIGLRLRRFSGELAATTLALLHGHAEQAGLLNAMIFGRRESLSVSDRDAFAISGTAHLLAISGLHIQLVCALIWKTLGVFGFSRRKTALWVLAACAAYCLLTGSSPPAVRATVMFAAYVAASFFQREADPLNALGAAALVVLSYAPRELFSAGFQLSFLAVFSLHALLPAFEAAWEDWRLRRARHIALTTGETPSRFDIVKGWIVKSMLITLAAWLATSPSVAWHMGRFSTLGFFVNLAALPFLSVCMAFGFVTLTLGYFWPALGQIAGWGALFAVSSLEWVTSTCAALPGSSIDMPRPAPLTLLAYAAALIWVWVARGSSGEFKRLCVIVPACPLLLLSNIFFRAVPAAPELTVLDLSRGRAALIETPDGAALIDAGESGQGVRIAEMLRRRYVHKLALWVITADEPGAMGGALELLARVRPARVILPRCKFPSEMRRALEALLAEKNIPYGSPAAEELIAPAGVRWEFLDDGPPAGQPAANGSALCARVSCGAFRALFAQAKSNASLTRLLAKSNAGFEADVLRVTPGELGHWPRETNELILRAGSPIVVAGTYANPDEAAGVDFEALPARVLSPHREGSIRIRADKSGKLEIHAYRGEWREVK